MALVLCHSPKGGAGTTFLASHIAMGLTHLEGSDWIDGDVTLLSLSPYDPMPLHFGLAPSVRLPGLLAHADTAVLASGINLRCEPNAISDPNFLTMLDDGGYLSPLSPRVLVLDVPAGERELARALMPYATVHVCPLTAAPDCLALLPQILGEAEDSKAGQTAYVIGRLDETRRLARHIAAFTREVLGDRLIGKIRQDQAVPEALATLQMLTRYAPSSAALADAREAARLVAGMVARIRATLTEEYRDEPDGSPAAPARAGKSRVA
jgi:hypothetical protein